MSINPIQFQRGLSLPDFLSQYGTEAQCESALELMRSLGISWRAAWRLKHKLLRAMQEREADRVLRVLRGRVEVDDAYLGGARSGNRGRGAAGKRPFVIAVETRPNPESGLSHPVCVRFDPLPDFRQTTLAHWAERALDVDTLMVSDGLAGFLAAGAQVTYHQRVVVHPRKSSGLDCFHWVNTLLGGSSPL